MSGQQCIHWLVVFLGLIHSLHGESDLDCWGLASLGVSLGAGNCPGTRLVVLLTGRGSSISLSVPWSP